MAEATLRGYIEVPADVAKALGKAGYTVITRYFIPKPGTKASAANGHGLPPGVTKACTPNTKNNFITIGARKHDDLMGDRLIIGGLAVEALSKRDGKRARRLDLKKYIVNKSKLTNKQVGNALTHLIKLDVLKDIGKYPPEWQKK